MIVRRLQREDVEVFRSLRLSALAADPDAFSSTFDRESAFSDDDWERPLRDPPARASAVFAAFDDGEPVGMTGVGDLDGDAHVWGMWVAPKARRSGVGHRLVDAAVDWARAYGAAGVTLWVMTDNQAAIELYRRYGFEHVVDDVPPAPPGCTDEQFMRFVL